MKNLKALLFVVAFGATLFFPRQSDAELFKRFKARRAAKNNTTCVGPDCIQHVGTGVPAQLRINRKGGFEGQLADQDFADYFAKKKTGTVAKAETAKDVPARIVEVNPAAATPVAEAEADVAAAEQNLRDKQEALRLAQRTEQRQAEKDLIALEAAEDTLTLEQSQSMDDLRERIESLREKLGKSIEPTPSPDN